MALDEKTYAEMADRELHNLQDQFDEFDPDVVEAFLSMGVLKVTFFEKDVCVINSHQAALQIWMAYDARAWHFAWDEERRSWRCTKTDVELYATVSQVVSARIGAQVAFKPLPR